MGLIKAKTKVLEEFIREAQYGDDIALFGDTAPGMQMLLTEYNSLARQMGLCINTSKTETICIGTNADFFIEDTKLANVIRFKNLGSYDINDCSMEEELASRIQAASCAFGCLRKGLFDSHDVTTKTKINVYNQCLLPILVHGSETWTLCQHQVQKLRTIQQRDPSLILKIRGGSFRQQ